MSVFRADWLALREPADEKSRCDSLVDTLRDKAPAGVRRIVDLGAGTGAGVRYLAPRLGGQQEWLLLDNDSALLGRAAACLSEWGESAGYRVAATDWFTEIEGEGFRCRVECRMADLASLRHVDLSAAWLVSASALLDLVTEDWLRRLSNDCRRLRALVYFALTYDGRIDMRPTLKGDSRIKALVNRHQLTDKGFGPALGPRAPVVARRLLGDAGYQVLSSRSDWRLGMSRSALQRELVDGWLSAAGEIAPHQLGESNRWWTLRRASIGVPGARIEVGHQDLVGWPV